MLTRFLLWCGILSSLWYVAINIIVPLFEPSYSVIDMTISELSATGAPTRAIWVPLAMLYTILFGLFGWGLIRARTNKWITAAGLLVILYAAFNLYWPPMHMRAILAAGGGTISDTLHLVWAGITVTLFIVIMFVASAGQNKNFRIFTGISLVLLLFFGFLTAQTAPHVAANLPTPFAGIYERINIGVFLLWVATLAILLLRRNRPETLQQS